MKRNYFPRKNKLRIRIRISEDQLYDNEVEVEDKKRVKKVWDVKSKKYLIVEL